jgi:hypothetical protein
MIESNLASQVQRIKFENQVLEAWLYATPKFENFKNEAELDYK